MKDLATFVQQLREVADWYEQHPDTALPHEESFGLRLYSVSTKEEAASLFRILAPCSKEWSAEFLHIVKILPSGRRQDRPSAGDRGARSRDCGMGVQLDPPGRRGRAGARP